MKTVFERQLDFSDPTDHAEFLLKMYSNMTLPPDVRFLMDHTTPAQLRVFVEDFVRQFGGRKPDESEFAVWDRLEHGNGQGWFAICVYHHFRRAGRALEFLTYVYARYGKDLPPGGRISPLTWIASFVSERAKDELVEQRAVRDNLLEIHGRVVDTYLTAA